MDEKEHEYRITNRERRTRPKRGHFWCCCCDMQLVGEREKCHVCGTKNNKWRLKKGPPPE